MQKPTATMPDPNLPTQHFSLDVQPESLEQAWHAWLRPVPGDTALEFDAPLDLLRYLIRLNDAPPIEDGLR
jgi:hypothetical protein